MAKNVGRPPMLDEDRKKVISVSMTLRDINTLDALCDLDEITRSQLVRRLIREAGVITHSAVQPDNSTLNHRGTGSCHLFDACNPKLEPQCKHYECVAIYKKEGLI
jgi:hypothetical protein